MSELNICICDENLNYLQLVQRYLLKRKLNNIEVLIFTDIEKVIEISKEKSIKLCLINESFLGEKIDKIEAEKIWILQEKKDTKCSYPIISKFQSMDRILEKVIEGIPEEKENKITKNTTKLLTFFETQKSKNILVGFEVSKFLSSLGKKILYINFSPFTKFNFITNQEGPDVTDLIYYILKDSNHLSKKVEIMKKEKDGVNFFMPAFDYKDLLELDSSQWMSIIEGLKSLEDYDYVVIETNGANRGLIEIYNESEVFFISEEDEGKDNFKELLEKRTSKGLKNLSTYEGIDTDYWKGKLAENGL